jgi:hypothetical protein
MLMIKRSKGLYVRFPAQQRKQLVTWARHQLQQIFSEIIRKRTYLTLAGERRRLGTMAIVCRVQAASQTTRGGDAAVRSVGVGWDRWWWHQEEEKKGMEETSGRGTREAVGKEESTKPSPWGGCISDVSGWLTSLDALFRGIKEDGLVH